MKRRHKQSQDPTQPRLPFAGVIRTGAASKADLVEDIERGVIDRMRGRSGLPELEHLRDDISAGRNLAEARELTWEARQFTANALSAYDGRGFDVRQIQQDLQRELGLMDLSEAGVVPAADTEEGATPLDVLNTVIDRVGNAWDRLEKDVVAQARAKVEDAGERAPDGLPARKRLIEESTDEIDLRVLTDMTRVFVRGDPLVGKLGGRGEALRARLGLRTFDALLERLQRRGGGADAGEALEVAGAWCERTYEITRTALDKLAKRNKDPKKAHLTHLNMRFADWLGHEGLGRYGDNLTGEGPRIQTDEWGEPVIRIVRDTVGETWREMKQIIEPRKH